MIPAWAQISFFLSMYLESDYQFYFGSLIWHLRSSLNDAVGFIPHLEISLIVIKYKDK